MEEIKAPKKERKFLKAIGNIAKVLANELVMGIGRKFIGKAIDKVGNKRQGLVIAFALVAGISYASIDSIPYPITGNKQKLGWQTSGNGLVYRGTAADTVTKPSNYTNKDIKAYLLVDTVNNVMYSYIASKGGWQFNNSDTVIINNNFAQPVDSLFFDTSVPSNNVDTAKMRWDSELATVVLGMYDQVPNELGFKNFWLVKNQTGSTITKGSIVYANGTVGASGRITVAKFIADGTIESKYVLGITAHDLTDGEDGYVISFGKIRQVNTDTFAAGAILYPSPTTAGVWTDVEPVAPNIDMPIGFCINSSVNNGTIAIKVESGFKLHELHDVAITSPVDKASLYYKGGLWRDTTAALLTSEAESTYLPLAGGTLTGALNGTTGTFNTRLGVGSFAGSPTLFTSGSGDQEIHFTHSDNVPGRKVSLRLTNNNSGFYTYGGLIYALQGEGLNQYNRMSLGVNTSEIMHLTRFSRVGIMNNSPSYTLDVNGTFNATGNSLIGGTLGVTGATTLSNLAGTGSRMVVAGSGGLLSTQAIPTGTVTSVSGTGAISSTGGTTPVISVATAAFGTAGIVSSTGTQQFSGDKVFEGITQFNGRAVFKDYTYTATRLGGLSSTDRFATVTIGSGLSLSSGTLSATGGGVTSVTASTPLSSSGGSTPNITITDAGTGVSGVVNTTTQSFAGNKTFTGTLNVNSTGTFGGRVKTNWLERNYAYSTSSSFTVSVNTTWQDINTSVLTTITLPNAATYPGKELHIRQTGAGSLQSASSNIIPFTVPPTGSTVTAILQPSNNRSVTLVSDGTNWIIMQRSGT